MSVIIASHFDRMRLSRASFLFFLLLVSSNANAEETSEPRIWLDWYAAFGPATWADWSLAVLALIAGAVGCFTLRAMNIQIGFGKTAAGAAIQAAQAAEDSNRQAREMAQVDLRAYVHVTKCGSIPTKVQGRAGR